ncbi:DUF397 domain-containing protein [Kitasatospora acidiphila]|uniref:DUF397 domain-containing protein n=1 Tax=Kitasatospora acidiphila TaxID=2567942 RepID=UPI003C749831
MKQAIPDAVWRKSTYSNGQGECVEVALAMEAVATRDSKDPAGPALTFRAAEWLGFIETIKAGGFPGA